MRRSFGLLLSGLIGIGLAGCATKGIGTLPGAPQAQLAQPFAAPARGSLIWTRYVKTFRKFDMNLRLGLAGKVIAEIGGAPKCEVALYAIKYVTIGVRGEPATASAAFFVPQHACKGPFTLVGYGQGTNVVEAQKITDPTKQNIEPPVLAAIFASHGYAVAATDYLGMGYSGYPYQPYLVVNSEASAVIDSMRAIRNAAAKLHVPLSGKVFLTGHSQGGQTALGTQKVIEADNASEFDLIADSPSSGPYALGQTATDGISKPGEDAAIYSTYFVTSFEHTYHNVYTLPQEIFQEPYASYVGDLLPVETYAQAAALAGKTLPISLTALYRPSFLTAFLNDPSSGARADLQTNDLLDGWKPKAPLFLCGGKRDPMVEFKNSRLALAYFKKQGATVHLLDVDPLMPPSVPITQYHDAVLVLCHTIERVDVLDSKTQRVRAGRWTTTDSGPIGPFGL